MKTKLSLVTVLSLLLPCSGDLVAYFPLNDGDAGGIAEVIDDVIDHPGHGVTDGVANNQSATWVDDEER